MRLSDYPKSWHTIAHILFMTTFNFQRSSLLLLKVIRVQSKQDNQVYKEMKG